MTTTPQPVGAGTREALAAGYEELRRAALDRAASSGRGIGFRLFIRSGMAARMEACAALLGPRDATARGPAAEPPHVPLDVRVEVAMLLAEMALAVHGHGGMPA